MYSLCYYLCSLRTKSWKGMYQFINQICDRTYLYAVLYLAKLVFLFFLLLLTLANIDTPVTKLTIVRTNA